MKVDQKYLDQSTASRLGRSQETQATTPARGEQRGVRSNQTGDQVQVSDFSGRILEMAKTEQPERVARVNQLAADYRAGRYQIDNGAIAKGLVHEATSNVS